MNNLQHIVANDTRTAMHVAVELCECGDFDSVTEAARWLMQERDEVLCESISNIEFKDIPKNPSGYGMKLTSEEIEQAVNELAMSRENTADGKCEYCNFDYNDRHMGWCYHTRVNYVKGAKKHSDVYEYAQLAHALTYQGDAETDYYELRIVRHGLGKYKDGYSSVEVDHCPWCGRSLR